MHNKSLKVQKMVVPVGLGEPLVSLEENGGRWVKFGLTPPPPFYLFRQSTLA